MNYQTTVGIKVAVTGEISCKSDDVDVVEDTTNHRLVVKIDEDALADSSHTLDSLTDELVTDNRIPAGIRVDVVAV